MYSSVARSLICMFPGLQVLGLVVFSFASVLPKKRSVLPVAEMKNMTMVEEKFIAGCRAKCCIVKLQDHRASVILPSPQRGIKGNILTYPQRVWELMNVLPRSLNPGGTVSLRTVEAVSSRVLPPADRIYLSLYCYLVPYRCGARAAGCAAGWIVRY